jgi:hypothetical protein
MRGRIADPSHEMIPGAVVNMFYQRAAELLVGARHRFGIKPVAEDDRYIARETTEARLEHDRARYQALGRIIDIIDLDKDKADEADDSDFGPLKTVIQTAVPSTEKWPNSYVYEGLTFLEPGDFVYELGARHYTLDGQAVLATDDNVDENAPRIVDVLRDTYDMSAAKGPDADYGGPDTKGFDELVGVYPDLAETHEPICTEEHFRRMLKIVKSTDIFEDTGNPFIRSQPAG